VFARNIIINAKKILLQDFLTKHLFATGMFSNFNCFFLALNGAKKFSRILRVTVINFYWTYDQLSFELFHSFTIIGIHFLAGEYIIFCMMLCNVVGWAVVECITTISINTNQVQFTITFKQISPHFSQRK